MTQAQAKSFPRDYWDPEMHAYLYLIEFLESGWRNTIHLDSPPRPGETEQEIQELIELAETERKANREAILDQANAFSHVFSRRLMFTAASHPRTFEVVKVAVLFGRAVVMNYKTEFNRPRPSQVSAAITPMIDVPGHPSYPSGHSTQAHLIAGMLSRVHPDGDKSEWREQIDALAADVARNRERAGVHYPSDSAAGKQLADQIFDIALNKCKSGLGKLMEEARQEWA